MHTYTMVLWCSALLILGVPTTLCLGAISRMFSSLRAFEWTSCRKSVIICIATCNCYTVWYLPIEPLMVSFILFLISTYCFPAQLPKLKPSVSSYLPATVLAPVDVIKTRIMFQGLWLENNTRHVKIGGKDILKVLKQPPKSGYNIQATWPTSDGTGNSHMPSAI